MNERVSESLFDSIKNNLNITWEDEESDAKIMEIIEDGISALDNIAGSALNYDVSGEPRRLLKAYCRYAWSGAESEFRSDYAPELTALNFAAQIKRRAENEQN